MSLTAAKAAFEGATVSYLAKATAALPTIPQVKGDASPKFAGDPTTYLAEHGDDVRYKRLLTNKIKKCANCGKPNAFTLDRCNACGTSLLETPISFSNNVFMGFAFGIQKGPFPFTVSIRHQDEDFLVMDDLLALAPLHFNVIPTKQYIPDWRFLLRKPAEGLKLVETMINRCELATKPFLENKEWCERMLKAPHEFDLKDIACGFNYPPSQYQLHIQYMMPNLLPFQYAQFIKGVHFTHKRFFPVSYVKECLQAAEKAPLPEELLQEDTPIADIINYFAAASIGIDYDKQHAAFMSNFRALTIKYAAWKPEDFEGSVVDINGKSIFATSTGGFDESVDVNALVNADKAALQNYGRPYTEDGKPTGSYYSFAVSNPADVQQW